MSNIQGLSTQEQVELELILSGVVRPEKAKEVAKSIFEVEEDVEDSPFKIIPENPDFMSLTTVEGGLEMNLRTCDVSAFFDYEGYTKIITDKMEITAHGTAAQFKALMETHIDEWGSF